MPIEFLCSQCPKKLRVPDDSAGKQVKCPACGHVQVIPSSGAAPSAAPTGEVRSPAPSPKPPQPPGGRVPAERASTDEPNPFAESAANPYQSPSSAASSPSVAPPFGGGGMAPATAKVLLTIPTAILLVSQGVNFLLTLLVLGFAIFMLVSPPEGVDAADQRVLWVSASTACGIGLILSLAAIACLTSTLFRKSYTAAWVGVLLGIIPCGLITNCPTLMLAVLAFAAGVWGIVLLCMPEGKAQFR